MTRTAFRPLLLVLGVLLTLASGGVLAAPPSGPVKLTPADLAEIARIETYLNNNRTLRAHFLQINENGSQLSGKFYLARPGRMRLEYAPPQTDFVVADGWFLFFWDGELQQQSSQPLGSSLADFILRDDIHLSGDITVTRFVRLPGVLEVSVVETDDPGKGELTLIFDERPVQLRKWRVVDAQSQVTTVSLYQVETGIKLDNDLFVFRSPVAPGPNRGK